MRHVSYRHVSGCIFAVIAILQAARAIRAVPVQLGGTAVPIWPSWIVAALAGSLSVWAFRSR
jgi:4'-phosphopantetheinyl transferase EntD